VNDNHTRQLSSVIDSDCQLSSVTTDGRARDPPSEFKNTGRFRYIGDVINSDAINSTAIRRTVKRHAQPRVSTRQGGNEMKPPNKRQLHQLMGKHAVEAKVPPCRFHEQVITTYVTPFRLWCRHPVVSSPVSGKRANRMIAQAAGQGGNIERNPGARPGGKCAAGFSPEWALVCTLRWLACFAL
jgi:hypothetical protein